MGTAQAAGYPPAPVPKTGLACSLHPLPPRHLLGCAPPPEVSLERPQAYFSRLFHTYGLPNRIRTDNGIPFASNALARLSQLSVWFIKLGLSPGPIEPGN